MSFTQLGVVFLLVVSTVSSDNSTVITRRKRYLSFPAKSVVVMSLSLLKGIANDVRAGPTTRVITFHELDILFPLPYDPSPFILSQTALGQEPVFHDSHRHRRHLFNQLEDVFYLNGADGRACLIKALCEAKNVVPSDVENLVLDLIMAIFRFPENAKKNNDYHVNEKDCEYFKRRCPFSIINTALDWAEQYCNELNKAH